MGEEFEIIIGMEIILSLLSLFSLVKIIKQLIIIGKTVKVKAKVVGVTDGGVIRDPKSGQSHELYYEAYEFELNGKRYTCQAGMPFGDSYRPIGTEVKIRIDPNDTSKTVSIRWLILHLIFLGTWVLSGVLNWFLFTA